MTEKTLDRDGVAEIPVHHLKAFMKFIGEHDLWDEVEAHLRTKGYSKMLISYEPMGHISELLQHKVSTGAVNKKVHILPHCGCNGPIGPRPGPVLTPPSHPPDGGGGGGGPDGGAGGGDAGGGGGGDGGGGGGGGETEQ
jgi:hypothetical protein